MAVRLLISNGASDGQSLDYQLPKGFYQQELEHGIEVFNQAFVQTDERERKRLETERLQTEVFEWLKRGGPEWFLRLTSEWLLGERLSGESVERKTFEREVSEWLERDASEPSERVLLNWSKRVASEWLERERREREASGGLEREGLERESLERDVSEWLERERREKEEIREKLRSLERELQKETREKEKLRKFHFSFIKQYQRLKRATEGPSTKLYQLSRQLHGHRHAWDAAITTMQRLSRLKSLPSLMDALCFLCVSRAVEETDEDSGNWYTSAFTQGLEQWRQIFPEIEDAARLMWGITFECIPQPHPTAQQHATMLNLREAVATLIAKANGMLDLGGWSVHNKMNALRASHQHWPRHVDEASPRMDPSNPQITAREKEPPDRLICPNITLLHQKFQGAVGFNPVIVTLVTSILFALAVYFVLGLLTLPGLQSIVSSLY
ncbi:hypothetical protein DL765_008790 [Monosporascus sp. GIB2]|nr:hypothetical protein DL765_008790 [Monosporascus sp. GIB2]